METTNFSKDEEDNTREIAEMIFRKPPGKKNSIQLQLEEHTANIANNQGIDLFIINILSLITLHGVEILFGHRQILQLTEKDFNLIQEYVMSYGYKINKRALDNKLIINFEKIY